MFYKQAAKLHLGVVGLMMVGVAGAATTTNTVIPPTLAFADPGYTNNGRITTSVANTPDCTGGTFMVNAVPVAGSGPGGTNPPGTGVTTYIGFPAGNFLFANAGYGQYRITTTTTACGAGAPPAPIVAIVTISRAVPASVPTLNGWAMLIMASLMGVFALGRMRRS